MKYKVQAIVNEQEQTVYKTDDYTAAMTWMSTQDTNPNFTDIRLVDETGKSTKGPTWKKSGLVCTRCGQETDVLQDGILDYAERCVYIRCGWIIRFDE